ncbi:TIGR02099 family protein [Acidihalobacter yilgarnensis]|uniref:TIGR02099 family protein n=1 Tax=Acidihalobacter yilgarnensis TaxID=2819280 RepID=A0A1D8IQ44_9GAMM|nr:TIGR02099 family protein [Acidihalobacter yilgarnensis]
MSRVLKRLLGTLWLGAAVVVILAAVLTVVARQLLPMVPSYRAEIESVASDWLHHPVRIGQIRVGWHWITPTVTLENVRVLDGTGKTALRLARVGLQLGVWNSFLAGRLVPGEISLQGARVVIARDSEGRLSISGLALPLPVDTGVQTPGGARLPPWLTRITYRLSDAHVVIEDLPRARRYRFSQVTLVARPADDGIDLAGGFALPTRLGNQVSFAANLRRTGEGASATWGGRIYFDLQGIRLDGLPLKSLLPDLPSLRGQLDAQVWSVWSQGRPTRVSGHLSVQDLSLGPTLSANAAAPGLTAFSGDVRWQALPAGWRLQGVQLHASAGQSAWPTDAFDATFNQQGDGQRSLRGWADFLRLQDLTPKLVQLPWLPDGWSDRLAALAPTGEVRDLRFNLRDSASAVAPQLALSAELKGISLRTDGHRPGFSGLSGQLAMTSAAGALDVDSTALRVNAPTVFGGVLPATHAKGMLWWRRGPLGDEVIAPHFDLSNTDLALHGQLGLWLPTGGPPDLNLMLGIERGNVAAAPRYLPVKLLHPDLVHWLKQALQGGTVTGGSIILRGDPADFPFRQHGGVFEARLNVSAGTLDYFRDWPRLKTMSGQLALHDFSLRAHVAQATMLSTQLSDVDLDIPDLDHAVLGISGSGVGPLGDVVTYLSHTPLGDGRKALFDEIQADGQTHFDLGLSIPLRAAELSQWSLHGKASIDDGSFALPEQDFSLNRINGKLDFTQRSLRAHDIQAIFRGAPAVLGVSTRSDGLATLTLDTHLSVARLFGAKSPVAHYAHGDTDWRMAFTLPMTRGGYRRYGMGLTLVSGLQGVQVTLPAPLGKPAAASLGLVAQRSLTRDDAPVFLRYGPDLQGLFQLAGKAGCRRVVRGDVRFNAGTPVLPSKDIAIQGHLTHFDVDAWRRVLNKLPSGPSLAECPDGGGPSTMDAVRHLRVDIGELDIFGRRLRKASIDATRKGTLWNAAVSSDVISGKLQVPAVLYGGKPVRFELSRLDLDGEVSASSASGDPIDPSSIPALSGHIGDLLVAGRHLHNVQLTTTPTREGMQIHLAEVNEPHLHARASGSWLRELDGHTMMQIQLEVDSDDAGKALDALNAQAGLAGGKGHLSATLSWPGGPAQLSWGVLDGQARLNLKHGRLMEVNPGQTGRLLGLLNLAALPQRLSLNFGDVFDKGFAFNEMNSRFQLRDGNIYTQDTHIAGASAAMSITGRVGMVTRDYDAQVAIVPQVQSTVAIAGAVLGGPVAGATLFLLDRLLGLGKQLNKAAEFRYRVTGPWDAPKIQPEDDTAKRKPVHGRDAQHENLF